MGAKVFAGNDTLAQAGLDAAPAPMPAFAP
jgi:hypothetical protein